MATQTRETAGNKAQPLRGRLLDLAFREIYENGYGGLRVDTLIDKAGSTKGAFYHHFASKTALGYAVVDEVLGAFADLVWTRHLAEFADPIEGIESSAQFAIAQLGPRCLELGCPFNNLAMEMSAVDEGFRQRIGALFALVIGNIAEALERGQRHGFVRADIDTATTANFIFAALEGSLSIIKAMGTETAFDISLRALRAYLETLRPDGWHKAQ